MRTSNAVVSLGLIGLAFGFSPAASFDGTRTPEMAPVTAPLSPSRVAPLGTVQVSPQQGGPAGPSLSSLPPPPAATPFDAFRSGNQMLREGRVDQGLMALEYAAERGVPGALWKLGRIYADGEGVGVDEKRAFDYFRSLTKAHAADPPGTPHARFVANAFVSLGHFYLKGIPDTDVRPDAVVAHGMFRHAASYFGDPEAQYLVGRMYLEGSGTPKDGVQASRWLRLAADNGQRNAQALLGSMLFKGKDVSRQAALGLFWLTVAKDAVAKEGGGSDDKWITDTYSAAFAQATEDERVMAHSYLERWMNRRR
ncbi:MAG: sel1 repeat family protein [Xanthobacteraceae bacterium]|nr:sel1 repeat family protein [Xanthobacteraceae bacterium]